LASSYKKRGIYALGLIKTPDPGADFGRRTERCPSQKLPVSRLHAHGFTGITATFGNGRLKYPGVSALERALLAGSQADGFHGF
jgi:hypothetical protein